MPKTREYFNVEWPKFKGRLARLVNSAVSEEETKAIMQILSASSGNGALIVNEEIQDNIMQQMGEDNKFANQLLKLRDDWINLQHELQLKEQESIEKYQSIELQSVIAEMTRLRDSLTLSSVNKFRVGVNNLHKDVIEKNGTRNGVKHSKSDRRGFDDPLDSLKHKISDSLTEALKTGTNIDDESCRLASLKRIFEILVKLDALSKEVNLPDPETQIKISKIESATVNDLNSVNKLIKNQIATLHLPTATKNLYQFARRHLWVLKFVDKKFDPDISDN